MLSFITGILSRVHILSVTKTGLQHTTPEKDRFVYVIPSLSQVAETH